MKEKNKLITYCLLLMFLFIIFSGNVYAKTDPTLVNKLNIALK